MNYLSKLLYWADVFDRISPISAIIGAISIIIACIAICMYCDGPNSKEDKEILKKFYLGFGFTGLIFITSFIFTPSKETIYAIAASEVGEQVLKSPIVGKAEKALETWLDKQINAK